MIKNNEVLQELGIQGMSPEEKKAWNKEHLYTNNCCPHFWADNETSWAVCEYTKCTSADIEERIVIYVALVQILENRHFKRMAINSYIDFGRDCILFNADLALPIEGSFLPDCASSLYNIVTNTSDEYLQGEKLVQWVKDYACYFPQVIEHSISKYFSTEVSLLSNMQVCTLIESQAYEPEQETDE